MGENYGLDLFLYVKLLLQLALPYDKTPHELRMTFGKTAKITSALGSPSQSMKNNFLSFEDICMMLDLLKHRSVCLSGEVNALLEEPPLPGYRSQERH